SFKKSEAQPPDESMQPPQPTRPVWATADWDEPVAPAAPKAAKEEVGPEPGEARAVGPEWRKLIATAEPRRPVSYFQYTRTPSGIVPCFENALIAVKTTSSIRFSTISTGFGGTASVGSTVG